VTLNQLPEHSNFVRPVLFFPHSHAVSAGVTEAASAAPRSPEVLIQLGARKGPYNNTQKRKQTNRPALEDFHERGGWEGAIGGA